MIIVEILLRFVMLVAIVMALPFVVFGIVQVMKEVEEVKQVDTKKSVPMCGDCLVDMYWSYDERCYVCSRCY